MRRLSSGFQVQSRPRRIDGSSRLVEVMSRVVMLRSHYPDARIEREAATLARNGYAVDLLAWDRGRVKSTEEPADYRLTRMNLKVRQDSITVMLALPFWWMFVVWQLLMRKWDIVHAADFDTFAPALLIAKLKRKPIIYDMFDFYADMFRFPLLLKPVRRLLGTIDRFLARFPDAVIIADDSRIAQLGPHPCKNVITVVNSPDEDIERSAGMEDRSEREGVKVFYGGAVTDDRGIENMCRAIDGLDGVQMTVMGPCSPIFEKRLRQVCGRNPNVELCLGWVPHPKIIDQTLKADVLFALYNPKIPNNRYASPNKVFEALMCGRPLIVSNHTSMAKIVVMEGCGVVVDYDDIPGLREAVLEMRDPSVVHAMRNNARRAYEEKYSWRIMEQRLLALYAGLRA